MRWRRRPNVKRLARKHKIDALIAALGYRDWAVTRDGSDVDLGVPVRRAALAALAETDEPQALHAMVELAASDADASVRLAVVGALTGRDEPEALRAVATSAADWRDPRYTAARAAALQAVRAAPQQTAGPVALTLVAREEESRLDAEDERLLREVTAGDAQAMAAAVQTLIAMLAHERITVQERAVACLVLLADGSCPALAAALDDQTRAERAAEALGRSRNGQALEPLLGLLESTSVGLRRAAALALGELRDPRAAEALFALAQDDAYEVRTAAAEALDRLGSTALLAAMASMLRPMVEPRGGRIELTAEPGEHSAAARFTLEAPGVQEPGTAQAALDRLHAATSRGLRTLTELRVAARDMRPAQARTRAGPLPRLLPRNPPATTLRRGSPANSVPGSGPAAGDEVHVGDEPAEASVEVATVWRRMFRRWS